MKNSKIQEEKYYYCDNNNNSNNNDNRAYNIKDNEQSGNTNWWSNELESLGITNNTSTNDEDNNNKSKFPSSQQLEDLTDSIKQTLIRNYKTCYDE